jgi:hypothetical protein
MAKNIKKFLILMSVVVLPVLVTGCVSAPKTLYNWEGYQAQAYLSLQGDGFVIEEQIIKLEEIMRKLKTENQSLPPGFRAQLGLLYSKNGRMDLAQQMWIEEKTIFPESSVFMNFLINKTKAKDKV